MSRPRIVFNKLLGAWFVVVGPHQTPLGGPHPTRAAALAKLRKRAAYAPRGSKRAALARLKSIVTDMLKRELKDV